GEHYQARYFNAAFADGKSSAGHSAQPATVAQQIPSLDDATRAKNRQGRDGAKTSGAPVLDDASGMGLPAVDQIRFARGTARKSPWCAVEHRDRKSTRLNSSH